MGTSGQDAASTVFSLIEEEKLGIVKQLYMEVNHEVSIPSVVELFNKFSKLCSKQLPVFPLQGRAQQLSDISTFKEQHLDLSSESSMTGNSLMIVMRTPMMGLIQAQLPQPYQDLMDMSKAVQIKAHTKIRVQQEMDKACPSPGPSTAKKQRGNQDKFIKERVIDPNYKPTYNSGNGKPGAPCAWHGWTLKNHTTAECWFEKAIKDGHYPAHKAKIP
jgi:hypothetical protein